MNNLNLTHEQCDGVRRSWYILQPVVVGSQWYIGNWHGDVYFELLADNWLDACAEIVTFREAFKQYTPKCSCGNICSELDEGFWCDKCNKLVA